MSKKVQTRSSGKVACHQGPVLKTGGGISGSSIPRTGYPPNGRGSASRYDQSMDSHSVDKRQKA